jgi:hypothetical protein
LVNGAEAEQGLECRHRRASAVVSEGEFIEVDLQVFGRDDTVGSGQPRFEVGDRPVGSGQDELAVFESVVLVDRTVVVAGACR